VVRSSAGAKPRRCRTIHSGVGPQWPAARAYATPDGRWRLPAAVNDVDPRFVEMLQTYEDQRFKH
jgi:hypothetical protein